MKCRICGIEGDGVPFNEWVKPTFTDHDKLHDGDVICDACLFWFGERSEELARRVGKEKPQRMRNYSHFVIGGKWTPLSKGNKNQMKSLLLGEHFPELAAIAESGQKHIVFRATRNPPGSKAGWVQFEEQALFVHPHKLRDLLGIIEALYATFSKEEIGTGRYRQYRIRKFGLANWQALELQVKPIRGSLLFKLALFLAQKGKSNEVAGTSSGAAGRDLARDSAGLQKPLSEDDLATVRGRGKECGVHQPAGQICQLAMPAFSGERGKEC